MRKLPVKIRIYFLSVLLTAWNSSWSQTSLKSWNTAQLNLSFSRKFDIRLSHLRAFELDQGFNRDFNQSSIQAGYALSKQLDIAGGYLFSGSGSLTDGSSRVYLKLAYKMKLAGVISWSNSVQGEWHAPGEYRYRYRIIWNSRLAPSKRISFMRLLPSVGYSLFYNIGGNSIQYYDSKTGLPAVRQTPDGFHRGRLMLNLNSKISKSFSLSVYYMMQREFNLFTPEYRAMNIVKPTNGRIVRPFDDFNVIGMTANFDIDLYKKKVTTKK